MKSDELDRGGIKPDSLPRRLTTSEAFKEVSCRTISCLVRYLMPVSARENWHLSRLEPKMHRYDKPGILMPY
jgi:hypothetical protein